SRACRNQAVLRNSRPTAPAVTCTNGSAGTSTARQVQNQGEPVPRSQPSASSPTSAGGTMLLRRLSKIFQRSTAGSGFLARPRAAVLKGTVPVISGGAVPFCTAVLWPSSDGAGTLEK